VLILAQCPREAAHVGLRRRCARIQLAPDSGGEAEGGWHLGGAYDALHSVAAPAAHDSLLPRPVLQGLRREEVAERGKQARRAAQRSPRTASQWRTMLLNSGGRRYYRRPGPMRDPRSRAAGQQAESTSGIFENPIDCVDRKAVSSGWYGGVDEIGSTSIFAHRTVGCRRWILADR
jgi:hypothetical protein